MEGFFHTFQMFHWYALLAVFAVAFVFAMVVFRRVPNEVVMFLLGHAGFALGTVSYATRSWPGTILVGTAFAGITIGATLTKAMRNYALERNRREAVGAAVRGVE